LKILITSVLLYFGLNAQQSISWEKWELIRSNDSDIDCPFSEVWFQNEGVCCIPITYDSVKCGSYKQEGKYVNIFTSLDNCKSFNPKNKFTYQYKRKNNNTVILSYNRFFLEIKKDLKSQ
jgi:hypothetical protein